MKLPNHDDLMITIPVRFDIDIDTAQALCSVLNLFCRQNRSKYEISAYGGKMGEYVEDVVYLEFKESKKKKEE